MSKNHLRNIALVGATGNSGSYMLSALLAAGTHTITAMTRASSSSTTSTPAGVHIAKVDYDDQASLISALTGQDALVITLSVTAHDQEKKLFTAAAAASVPYVITNDWGLDYDADHDLAQRSLTAGLRLEIHKWMDSVPNAPKRIKVSCGFFYEWSLAIPAAFGFDFQKRHAIMVDGGEYRQCVSTWPQLGRAVAAILSLPVDGEGGGNGEVCLASLAGRCVRIASFQVSQREMFESVLRVTGTQESEWTIEKQEHEARYNGGLKKMGEGNTWEGFAEALYTSTLWPGEPAFYQEETLANRTLGLPKESLDEATKAGIERAKAEAAKRGQ